MRRFITNIQHGLEKDRKQERVELNWDYVFDKLLGGRDAALRRPRPAGRNERKKRPLFRRLTLRSATGTAQRAVPTLKVCE
jgi:hypothetical protein